MRTRRLTPILPAMTLSKALETTQIPLVAGRTGDHKAVVTTLQCCAHHNPISDVGPIGWSHWRRPGEVSLAHKGVLFLNEQPAFGRHVLASLRQPLGENIMIIARTSKSMICRVASPGQA